MWRRDRYSVPGAMSKPVCSYKIAALVARLREQTVLLLTPGTEYRGNGKGFVRVNLAYPTTVIEDALARLVRGVKAYQAQK